MSKYVRGSRSRQPKTQLAQVLHLVAALLVGYSLTATAAPGVRTHAGKSRSLQQNVASSGSFTVSNLRPVTPTPQQPDEELPERFNSGSTLAADTIEISFKVPGVYTAYFCYPCQLQHDCLCLHPMLLGTHTQCQEAASLIC